MVNIEIGDGWVLAQARKCLLVLSREEFINAMKRSKTWRWSQAMAAQLATQEKEARRMEKPKDRSSLGRIMPANARPMESIADKPQHPRSSKRGKKRVRGQRRAAKSR